MSLDGIIARHNKSMDAMIAAFETHLSEAVSRAQARTVAQVVSKLAIVDGQIVQSAANLRVLRTLDALFSANLEIAGYQRIISGFVNSFAGQVPYFQEILSALSEDLKEKFAVKFTGQDLKYFAAVQVSDLQSLQTEIEAGGMMAKRAALFSIGGLPVDTLSDRLAKAFGLALSRAQSLASTALPTFYRTIASRGFEKIQAELHPGNVLKYSYYGPLDKLNRPFCRRMMEESDGGKRWTKEEIEGMSNGSGLPVLTTCGGWNCRHQWLVQSIEGTQK